MKTDIFKNLCLISKNLILLDKLLSTTTIEFVKGSEEEKFLYNIRTLVNAISVYYENLVNSIDTLIDVQTELIDKD